jgi:multiple sugar transport system substrate-binding protein
MRTLQTRRQFVGSTLAAGAGAAALSLSPRFGLYTASAQTELTWAVDNFQPAEVDLVQQVVDNFVAANPGYAIDVLAYDPETYDQKLIADVAAGTLPDIFVNFDVQTKTFFDQGLSADLKPFMDETGPKVEDFDPKFIELAIYDGKVGFLPRAGDVVVLYYNKRMFDEAELEYPTEEWTYDDLLANAEKLTITADDGTVTQYGLTADYAWWAQWVPMVVAEGGEILSEDNTQVVFNSEAGYRAWDILFTGLKNGWFCPPNVQSTMGGTFIPFGTAKAAMTYFIRGGCPNFREQLTDDWDVQLPPRGSVDRKTGMGTMGYAMSAQTKDPAATWEVLHYLFTEGMKIFMESYMVVPPITSFYDDPVWRDLPGPPYNNDVFVKAFDIAMLPPKLDFYSTGPFNKAMTDGIDAVLLGNMTTKDAVDRMAAEATKALTG